MCINACIALQSHDWLIRYSKRVFYISHTDAVASQGSFFKLCSRVKMLLICFVVFTLSSGIGFLDATLSIFAMEEVISH